MKTIKVTQGSPEWHAFRNEHNTASDAPAAMGFSKHKTRTQLITEKATGITPEVSEFQQKIFARGHEAEASARPIAEEIAGEELFPATGESSEHPALAASFDGITMAEDVIFEHKLINEDLSVATVETLHEMYKVQMDHQLLVSGAGKCLFMASDGTKENCNWFWYERDEGRLADVLAAWKQVDADVKDYTPPAEVEVLPIAKPDSLPSLRIQVTGMVTASNLEEFERAAVAVFDSINRDLKTDQDFADAENTVKWCGEVEARLVNAKAAALQQTESIDQLFQAIDQVAEEARQTRLQLDKLVKARKAAIREEIVIDARNKMTAHIDQINSTLGGKIKMPAIAADFAGAIKGKKTVASLQDAADTELARAKIEANQVADKMRLNLETLRADSVGYEGLFADAQQLMLKDNEDLKNLIAARIAERKAEDEKRLEAEREKIRAEEQRKAEQGKVVSPEPVEPQQSAMAEVSKPVSGKAPAETRRKPTPAAMVSVLGAYYKVSDETIIEWLSPMFLENAKSGAAA